MILAFIAAATLPPPPPPPTFDPFMILFDSRSAAITADGKSIVEHIADLARSKTMACVDLTGHADAREGAPPDTMRLSLARAIAVQTMLRSVLPDSVKLTVSGMGDAQPIYATHHRANQRVDVMIDACNLR